MTSNSGISDFPTFYQACQRYRSGFWVFRGVPDEAFDLTPKIARSGIAPRNERRLFEAFVREAAAHGTELPSAPFEQLAVAQHHGLPTRLLDWTENPLVAAYFASLGDHSCNGAIFALCCSRVLKTQDVSPFDIQELIRYRPRHITRRISAQRGLFTIHPDPRTPLVHIPNQQILVHKLALAAGFKNKLRWNLSRFGVNEATLFPDLAGLAANLTWSYSNDDPSEEEREPIPWLRTAPAQALEPLA